MSPKTRSELKLLFISAAIVAYPATCYIRADMMQQGWIDIVEREIPGGINHETFLRNEDLKFQLPDTNSFLQGAAGIKANPQAVAELEKFKTPVLGIIVSERVGRVDGHMHMSDFIYDEVGQGLSTNIPNRLRAADLEECQTLVILRSFHYESAEARRGAGSRVVSNQSYFLTFYDIKSKRSSSTYRFCTGWISDPFVYSELRDLLEFLYPEQF